MAVTLASLGLDVLVAMGDQSGNTDGAKTIFLHQMDDYEETKVSMIDFSALHTSVKLALTYALFWANKNILSNRKPPFICAKSTAFK